MAMLVDPAEVFQGDVVITVPHMDDEVLACGGTIALLPHKERIHLLYATDGMRAPAPIVPWWDAVSPDLGLVRRQESQAAMGYLGIPQNNLHFLCLPEGRLKHHTTELYQSFTKLIRKIKPTHVLTPFRYDRHPDHLTLNQVVTAACQQGMLKATLAEYFVYYRWKLLPEGDVRQYIHPQRLFEVNIEAVSAQKRRALDYFTSQTTRFYNWQTRPNLTPELLDEVSRTPEFFLRYEPSLPGSAVFTKSVTWIRLSHRLEPYMKKTKDQVVALLSRCLQRASENGKT